MRSTPVPSSIQALEHDLDIIASLRTQQIGEQEAISVLMQTVDRAASVLKVGSDVPDALVPHLVSAHKAAVNYQPKAVIRHLGRAIEIYLARFAKLAPPSA